MKQIVTALFKGMGGDAKEYGSNMAAHMPTLYLLASRWAFGEVVELGVGRGWSTISFLTALADRKKLVSVDFDKERYAAVRAASGLSDAELTRIWDFRVKNSLSAAQDFADGSVSLMFLDTSHLYEDTKKELDTWLPKIHPHGIMLGHDYYLHEYPGWETLSGVKRVVDEFARVHAGRFRLQVLPHDQGLYVFWPRVTEG